MSGGAVSVDYRRKLHPFDGQYRHKFNTVRRICNKVNAVNAIMTSRRKDLVGKEQSSDKSSKDF